MLKMNKILAVLILPLMFFTGLANADDWVPVSKSQGWQSYVFKDEFTDKVSGAGINHTSLSKDGSMKYLITLQCESKDVGSESNLYQTPSTDFDPYGFGEYSDTTLNVALKASNKPMLKMTTAKGELGGVFFTKEQMKEVLNYFIGNDAVKVRVTSPSKPSKEDNMTLHVAGLKDVIAGSPECSNVLK